MAKKKIARGGAKKESREGKTISPSESKQFQAMLARVGSHKSEGFIFLGETTGKKTPKGTKANGLVFSHGIDRGDIVLNLVDNLFPNTLDRLMFAMKLVRWMKETSK